MLADGARERAYGGSSGGRRRRQQWRAAAAAAAAAAAVTLALAPLVVARHSCRRLLAVASPRQCVSATDDVALGAAR